MAADIIEQAIAGIADGMPFNWSAAESGAQSDDERDYLKCLRVLSEIADVHRSSAVERSPGGKGAFAGTEFDSDALTDGDVDLWGRYRLIEKVGEGSFGSVYRAWDPELEREIAIKILHQHIADRELKERLLDEGRALARIRHPNVVSVFGVESHGDRVGLCMEFVRGETLEAELASRQTLGARETILIAEDVCRALAAVHRAGFVHRDVKARNVMREQGGRIVLMDFGTGRETEGLMGGRFGIAGTPLYMAPEVLTGEAATHGSDVYSVGVLVYHLVTGEYPVTGRTLDDLREAHRQRRRSRLIERRPDLPLPFVQVVESALGADARERCGSAGALLEALAAAGAEERLSVGRLMLIGVVAAGGVVAVLTAFGMLASRAFHASLNLSDYSAKLSNFSADDTVWTWLKEGGQTCVGPLVVLLIILGSVGLCVVVRNLLLATSARAQRLDQAARNRLGELVLRFHLDDVAVQASAVVFVSALALLAALWHYSPLLEATLVDLSTAPRETLKLLVRPAGRLNAYHENCRLTFAWIVDLSILAWYLVLRSAGKKRQSLHRGVLVGGGAIVVLALGSLIFPFQLLRHAGTHSQKVRWQNADCYVIGERRDSLLLMLFCPERQPSRNKDDVKESEIKRTGDPESIFTRFADSH